MSEKNHPESPEEKDLRAPPRLVEALRRLDQHDIEVPPQVDHYALNRPRLLLSQIRRRRQGSDDSAIAPEEELPLAARTQTSGLPAAPFATRESLPPAPPRRGQFRVWKLLLLVIALVLGAILLLRLLR
jgi:hypothetical protein